MVQHLPTLKSGRTSAMQVYSIYKITNIVNSKVYIGFSKNPEKRWKSHKSFRGHANRLYSSMKNHGIENFRFEVIYQSLDKEYCLNIMEPHFIQEYNSIIDLFGYNLSIGGNCPPNQSGIPKTQSHKNNISKAKKGNKQPWATSENIGCIKRRKTYLIYKTDGSITKVNGLNKYCRETGYQERGIGAVANKEWKKYKDIIRVDKLGFLHDEKILH